MPLQLNKLVFYMPTPASVDFMVFLARLNRLEAALGWVLRMEVRFGGQHDQRESDQGCSKATPQALTPS